MSRLGDIRKAAGLTQTGLAKALGVSRSTIQRYEYGTSKHGKVAEYYSNLAKNATLFDEYKSLREKARKRFKELVSAGIEKDSFAGRRFDESGVPSEYIVGENKPKLQREIGRMRTFLESQTSTVEGYELWKSNVDYASKITSGSETYYENDQFWELYNELKKDDTWNKYWNGTKFDSEQLIYDIWVEKVKIKNRGGRWNAKKIKKALKGE